MGFSRQESWGGLPLPSPGDLPDPGMEPMSPEFQADSLPQSQLALDVYKGSAEAPLLCGGVVWFVLFLRELERVINEQQRLELDHVEYFCPYS